MSDVELPVELSRFLERVERLSGEEVRALSAWPDEAKDAARRERARLAAGVAIGRAGRDSAWQQVSAGLRRWASAPRDFVPWPDRVFPTPDWFDVDAMSFRMRALPHLLDAAAALMVRERLAPEDSTSLLAPWQAIPEGLAGIPAAAHRAAANGARPPSRFRLIVGTTLLVYLLLGWVASLTTGGAPIGAGWVVAAVAVFVLVAGTILIARRG